MIIKVLMWKLFRMMQRWKFSMSKTVKVIFFNDFLMSIYLSTFIVYGWLQSKIFVCENFVVMNAGN